MTSGTHRSARALLLLLAGCASDSSLSTDLSILKVEPGKEDSSAEAVFVELTFEGELLTDSTWNLERQIENQLLYTIGHLNGDRSVGRLDQVALTNIQSEDAEGRTLVRYQATLPVAWGRRERVPETYTFTLPRDMSGSALDGFVESYGRDCVDWGAHDVDAGSMWYYYRPARFACAFEEGDVIRAEATIAPSPSQTTGRFPEYDEVWRDGVFRTTAVFGKYEDGATTAADAGVAAYGAFVEALRARLGPYAVEIEPAGLAERPGVEAPEVTFRATLDETHQVEIVVLLVDNVRTAGASFDARYAELSTDSDVIVYNGHAGLGANIRALARKGRWVTGQYAIVFMNGCDTYAYVDSALWDAHAEVNPDDPAGSKYLDLISNALPSYFRSMPRATLALIDGLLNYEAPRTYEQIFGDIDSSQVVLVSGEHDNDFVPNGGGAPEAWAGLEESGRLERGERARFETPVLEPGTYTFSLSGSGDADLYVRIGAEPSYEAYDCRPYRANSQETCTLELAAPASLHVLLDGFAPSEFTLLGS